MKICMGCMGQYRDEYNICPHCGFYEGARAEEAMHMDPGSILSDRYIVGKVVGFGGFGVTYIGWDAKLERRIAIKEYLPGEFSTRVPGHTQITVFSDSTKIDQFNTGMKKFIDEARSLAQFQNEDGIVKVYDTFEENNTAYIVMEFLEGETLTEALKREETIPVDKAVEMLLPIVRSLRTVHEHGIVHRDIAPDNIHIGTNGKIKLIDFGAARYATTNHSRSLTVIIKPGYSPEEQYRSRGDQGPHTDVYAIGAVLYRMITGKTPPDAMERRAMFEKYGKDMLSPIEKISKDIPENRAAAITNALNVRIENRTPDMNELERELTTGEEVARREGRIKKIDILKAPLPVKIGIGAAAAAVLTLSALFITGVIGFDALLKTSMSIPEGMARVPSIVNNELSEAEARVTEFSLLSAIVGKEYSTRVPADRVLTQDLTAGGIVPINSMLSIVISGGFETKILDDISGEDVESVRLSLEEKGFTVRIVQEYNNEYAPGTVIEQDTLAGEELAVGETVTLRVSMGRDPSEPFNPSPATVPSLEGMTAVEAKEVLVKKGFMFKITRREYSDDIPEAQIISQSLPVGADAMTGDIVEIVVSKGPFVAYVPDVQYKHLDEAKYLLQEQQLVYTVTYEESETIQADHVISQSVAPKTKLSAGESVALVVSKGGKPIPVPDAAADNPKLEDARTILTAAGFSVSVSYVRSETVPEGRVISQSVSPGVMASRGESIMLTVSSGKDKQTAILPQVTGRAQTEAKSMLESAGFKVSVSELESETVLKGNVISQSPAGGTEQMKGSTVYITVSKGEPAVVIPDVKGQSQSMAEKMLRDSKLTPAVTTEFSKAEDKDRVINQSPRAGANAKRGDTVTITVSLGAKTNQMPNVIGQTQTTAESSINALKLNLSISVTQEYSDTIPEGSVVSQNPWAGESVSEGASVKLVVSRGGNPVSIPNVVGATENAARDQLNNAGLRVGSVSQEYHETIEMGKVISQSPSSGTQAKKGDTVNLVVSKGAEEITVPGLAGYQLEDARSKNKDFNIVQKSDSYSDTIASGFIISQNPAAGTKAPKGTTIDVVVSKGKEPIVVPDVVGMIQSQAESALSAAGFKVSVENGTSMTVDKGKIISQVPAGKLQAPKGDTVRIVVCVGKPQVTVPNFASISGESSVRSAATNALLVAEVKWQSHDTVPSGNFISQDKAAGSSVDQGSTVVVTLSSGVAEVKVPTGVVGAQWSSVKTLLEAEPYRFQTHLENVFSDSVPKDAVISVSPPSGQDVPKFSLISVVVSMGKKPVPDVVGDSEATARTKLEADGFSVLVNYTLETPDAKEYHDSLSSGESFNKKNVSSQNPPAGNTNYSGKQVTISIPSTLSLGQPVVPGVVNITKSAAESAIANVGYNSDFKVTYSADEYSNDVTTGSVVRQMPSQGPAAIGTTITLTLSKGKPSVPNVLNQSESAARSTIAAVTGAGFTVTTTERYDNATAGTVIEQSVTGTANIGTTITLTLSKGKPSVPNVLNQSESAARSTIAAVTGASFLVTTTERYDNATAGTVIEQSPSGGTTVSVGSTITLTISKGPEPAVVTSVSVSPSSHTVDAGGSASFSATVNGTGNPSQSVKWSVSGGTNSSTYMSGSTLYVGADETQTSLTVTATSTDDSSKSGTAHVTVNIPTPPQEST